MLGLLKDKDHWQTCFEAVQDNMDMAVASVFVGQAFPKEKKTVVRIHICILYFKSFNKQ